jgi:hypothetical protein
MVRGEIPVRGESTCPGLGGDPEKLHWVGATRGGSNHLSPILLEMEDTMAGLLLCDRT